MRILIMLLSLLGAGLVITEAGNGQLQAESGNAGHPSDGFGSESRVALAATSGARAAGMQPGGPSYERIAIGTMLGAVVGGATGMGIIGVTRGQPSDANMFPWADLAAGAVLGSAAGMYLGARLSSSRQGSSWMTGAAAVGGTALGVLAGVAAGSLLAEGNTGRAPEVLGFGLGVAIPLALTSFAEWSTAR
jgi:hypothetical protein